MIERAASDAEIAKWFDLHTRSAADYLAAKRQAWAEGTGASFAICDATRPDTCRGHVFVERDEDGRGSVGYWLLEDSRGKGRAAKAVRLMASWALPQMRLGRLQLHTDPENVASQRAAERAGFTREGVFRAYNARRDGTRADAVVYSLLAQDLAAANWGVSLPVTLPLIDHLALRVRDVRRSRTFYERALEPFGVKVVESSQGPGFAIEGGGDFWIGAGEPPAAPVHVAFAAPDRATVDEFHRAAVEAGGRDNGAPGLRPQYHAGYYAAFVLDPDGNNVEAVFHGDTELPAA